MIVAWLKKRQFVFQYVYKLKNRESEFSHRNLTDDYLKLF